MSASHVVDDIYQGCVPALLPFLVAERHCTYAAVSGLTLAATVLSSVAQPAFGWWTDRRPRRWMIPVGMSTAGIGVALSGLSTSYVLTWLAFALSGLGIAAFHPEGARAARQAAGNSTRAMSLFALGGNTGFAIGPLFATPVLLATGVRGTGLLVVPAAVMAVVLLTRLNRVLDGAGGRHRGARLPTGADDWPLFLRLTAVVVVRSRVCREWAAPARSWCAQCTVGRRVADTSRTTITKGARVAEALDLQHGPGGYDVTYRRVSPNSFGA